MDIQTAKEIQTIRDNAQEIAVREAGQIARWQQVQAAVDAFIPAAQRYIQKALPVPRSSDQNTADRSDAYSEVEYLLLRTIAAIRFSLDVDDVGPETILKLTSDMHRGYMYLAQRIERESVHVSEASEPSNPEALLGVSPQPTHDDSKCSALAKFLDDESV